MSRVGKQPISIPDGVQVDVNDTVVKVKGPKGELSRDFRALAVKIKKDKDLVVELKNPQKKAMWGLARSLLANMVIGVHEGFEKKLEVQGVGFKAAAQGKSLKLDIGFSHSVEVDLPEGIEVKVEKNIIVFSGADNEKLGNFTAEVRKLRPPEPYKGKGLRYLGEHVRMKEGKKAAGEAGAAGGTA